MINFNEVLIEATDQALESFLRSLYPTPSPTKLAEIVDLVRLFKQGLVSSSRLEPVKFRNYLSKFKNDEHLRFVLNSLCLEILEVAT